MTIPDIFESRGEAEFRDGERRVIARLLEEPPFLLATGGGAFIDDSTRALLAEKATTVWMRADLNVLVRRCSRRGNRPLLKNGDPREILGRLIEERYPIYAEADIEVYSRDEPHAIAVNEIIRVLKARGDLVAT
jgi:shikimate kinase